MPDTPNANPNEIAANFMICTHLFHNIMNTTIMNLSYVHLVDTRHGKPFKISQ